MALFDFIGVGGLAYDLVLQVERLPLADDKYPASLGKLPGGFIANATCAAARLGLRTSYIGWVGDDDDGEHADRGLHRLGRRPGGLVRVPAKRRPSPW